MSIGRLRVAHDHPQSKPPEDRRRVVGCSPVRQSRPVPFSLRFPHDQFHEKRRILNQRSHTEPHDRQPLLVCRALVRHRYSEVLLLTRHVLLAPVFVAAFTRSTRTSAGTSTATVSRTVISTPPTHHRTPLRS